MITLKKMTQTAFEQFERHAIADYQKQKMIAEHLSEDTAATLSRTSHEELLKNGLETPNHFLFSVIESASNNNIGYVWFGLQEIGKHKRVYIYNLTLDEAHRGKGYGSQLMALIEKAAKELDAHDLKLHVFSHNKVAQNLYKKMSFQSAGIMMIKKLT